MSAAEEPMTFTISWGDGLQLSGRLPPVVAARVIDAAMRPTTVLRFPGSTSPEVVDNIRRRFSPGGAS